MLEIYESEQERIAIEIEIELNRNRIIEMMAHLILYFSYVPGEEKKPILI